VAYPIFPVWQLNAPDAGIGASSGPQSCSPGDQIVLTGVIRYVSGDAPQLELDFYQPDGSPVVAGGSTAFVCPVTDTGWHFATLAIVAPATAAYFIVSTTSSGAAAQWEVGPYQLMQNGQAVSSPFSAFSASLTSYGFVR
jgi:hypothetical protein